MQNSEKPVWNLQIPALNSVSVAVHQAREAIFEAGGKIRRDGSVVHPQLSLSLPGIILPYPNLGAVVIARQPVEETANGKGVPLQLGMEGTVFSPIGLEIHTPDGGYAEFVQWHPRLWKCDHSDRGGPTRHLKPGSLEVVRENLPAEYFEPTEKWDGKAKEWMLIDHLAEHWQAAEWLFTTAWFRLSKAIEARSIVLETEPISDLSLKPHPPVLRVREWNVNPYDPVVQFTLWQAFISDCIGNLVLDAARGYRWGIAVDELVLQKQFVEPWMWLVVNGWLKFGLYKRKWPQIYKWLIGFDVTPPSTYKKRLGGRLHVAATSGRATDEEESEPITAKLPQADQADPHKLLPYVKGSKSPRRMIKVALAYRNLGAYQGAIRWYMHAAACGNPSAMYELARCDEWGAGVLMSDREREGWMSKATKASSGRGIPSYSDAR